MIIIALFQAGAINTRGHLQTQPSCPGLSPAPAGGARRHGWVRSYPGAQPALEGGAQPHGEGGIRAGSFPAAPLQGDASGEDKGNILRGCNVNRAGAEPLFMESLSCQGICQGPDLRSYLDKGAGEGGAELASKSQDTLRCRAPGADKEVAEGLGPNPQPRAGQVMGAERGGSRGAGGCRDPR